MENLCAVLSPYRRYATLQLYASVRAEYNNQKSFFFSFKRIICLNLFQKLRVFRLYCCQLILESIANVHLKFHRTIANLKVIFARGSGVWRDCADVQARQSINLLLAYGISTKI